MNIFRKLLRDWLAAHAPVVPDEFVRLDPWTGDGHLQCLSPQAKQAFWAYRYADAMLERRAKK